MSEPEKFGTYLVYELLGKGGMATVHRAESLSAGGFRKRVALKRLLPHLLDEPEVTESFARETTLALDDIVMTALSRDPGLRWQSAAAMRAALVNLARDVKMAPSREGLAKWTEWAFTQSVRKDDGLSQVIQMLGDPSDQRPITVEPDEVLTPTPVKRRKALLPPTVVGSRKLEAVVGGM